MDRVFCAEIAAETRVAERDPRYYIQSAGSCRIVVVTWLRTRKYRFFGIAIRKIFVGFCAASGCTLSADDITGPDGGSVNGFRYSLLLVTRNNILNRLNR